MSLRRDGTPRCTCTPRANPPKSTKREWRARTGKNWPAGGAIRPRWWRDSPRGVGRFGSPAWGLTPPRPRGGPTRLARLHCPRAETPPVSGRVRRRGPLMTAGGGEPVFRSPRPRLSMSSRWRSNRASSRGHTSHPRDVARRWSCPHNSSTEPALSGYQRD